MLLALLEQNLLTPLDLFFADLHPEALPSQKVFLATLMMLSRAGHLCLDLDRLSLEATWKQEVISGVTISPYIHQEGSCFYLKKNYVAETQILHHLERLTSCAKPLDIAPPSTLNAEQQKAFTNALSHSLSIIEGGPGTGKTFLTSHLVQAFLQEKSEARIILTAPTGKATARLKQFNSNASCGTLHSLLGIRSEKKLARGRSYLAADLIIVDESSMIDVHLLAFFLASLEPGTRVVFLGDAHQLPPVESGSLFGDLVDLVPTAHLKTSLRSDRIEILHLAQQVLAGQTIHPHQPLSKQFLIEQALKSVVILSPLREGPFGVNQLNETIAHHFLRNLKPLETLAVPILITRTDYNLGLYNGEMGTLWRTVEKPLYAEFPTPEGVRKIPASALPSYELGYVLSVHKSQGSEFNEVVIALPPGSEAFGREVLYTAITRAKNSVILCGDEETVNKTVERSHQRLSGLSKRFKQKLC